MNRVEGTTGEKESSKRLECVWGVAGISPSIINREMGVRPVPRSLASQSSIEVTTAEQCLSATNQDAKDPMVRCMSVNIIARALHHATLKDSMKTVVDQHT